MTISSSTPSTIAHGPQNPNDPVSTLSLLAGPQPTIVRPTHQTATATASARLRESTRAAMSAAARTTRSMLRSSDLRVCRTDRSDVAKVRAAGPPVIALRADLAGRAPRLNGRGWIGRGADG